MLRIGIDPKEFCMTILVNNISTPPSVEEICKEALELTFVGNLVYSISHREVKSVVMYCYKYYFLDNSNFNQDLNNFHAHFTEFEPSTDLIPAEQLPFFVSINQEGRTDTYRYISEMETRAMYCHLQKQHPKADISHNLMS